MIASNIPGLSPRLLAFDNLRDLLALQRSLTRTYYYTTLLRLTPQKKKKKICWFVLEYCFVCFFECRVCNRLGSGLDPPTHSPSVSSSVAKDIPPYYILWRWSTKHPSPSPWYPLLFFTILECRHVAHCASMDHSSFPFVPFISFPFDRFPFGLLSSLRRRLPHASPWLFPP